MQILDPNLVPLGPLLSVSGACLRHHDHPIPDIKKKKKRKGQAAAEPSLRERGADIYMLNHQMLLRVASG